MQSQEITGATEDDPVARENITSTLHRMAHQVDEIHRTMQAIRPLAEAWQRGGLRALRTAAWRRGGTR